jgi:hypothetical protein
LGMPRVVLLDPTGRDSSLPAYVPPPNMGVPRVGDRIALYRRGRTVPTRMGRVSDVVWHFFEDPDEPGEVEISIELDAR